MVLTTARATTKTGINLVVYTKAPVDRGFLLSFILNTNMETFNKEIVVGKETRVFEFTQMRNVNGVKFFVTSKDANKKAISFSLTKKDRDWKLLPGSLRWLYDIETELADAIENTRQP